jgi:ligand-binding sensor domain-containing protein
MKFRFYIIFLLAQVFFQLDGQNNFFRQYGFADGLSNSFLYAINQDKEGYLWIGTAEGLYRFDGFEFQHFTDRDSLAENFITAIYKDFSGGLWLGHMSGGITHVSDDGFRILTGTSTYNSPVTSITEADTGTIWFSTQNEGLLVSYPNHDLIQVSTQLDNELIFTIRHITGNLFLVGTQENLYVMEYLKDSGTLSVKVRIKEYPLSKVVDILIEKDGGYFILSQDEGIFMLTFKPETLVYDLEKISSNSNGQLDNIQGALITNVNEFWVYMMGNRIIKYSRKNESGKFLISGGKYE